MRRWRASSASAVIGIGDLLFDLRGEEQIEMAATSSAAPGRGIATAGDLSDPRRPLPDPKV